MARKSLTDAEEQRAIADAIAARDDPGSTPVAVRATTDVDATVVLSVRLPLREARKLRELAQRDGMSISELLTKALTQFVDRAGPQFSFSNIRSMYVYRGLEGPQATAAGTEGPTVRIAEPPQANSGQYPMSGT